MKKLFISHFVVLSVILFGFMVPSGSAADKSPMGMVTGSASGTYIQFGKQIAQVAKQEGVEILVKTSGGSLDNIQRIRSKENAALGIVQSDVLGFILKRSEDPQLHQFVKHLRLIFPFYNEEVHLFANKGITSIQDLQGKTVAIGTENSGNFVTSINLFHIMEIEPKTVVTDLKPAEAAAAVISKEIDAMIYVAGKPVTLFNDLEKIKENPELAPYFEETHFVPLGNEELLKEYVASKISSADYKWFSGEVPTVAVKAVLIGYDFSRGQSPYYQMRCNQLSRVGMAIRENISWLKQNGHKKWQEVDLEQQVGIWEADTCSRKVVPPKKKKLHEKIMDVIKREG